MKQNTNPKKDKPNRPHCGAAWLGLPALWDALPTSHARTVSNLLLLRCCRSLFPSLPPSEGGRGRLWLGDQVPSYISSDKTGAFGEAAEVLGLGERAGDGPQLTGFLGPGDDPEGEDLFPWASLHRPCLQGETPQGLCG